MLIKEIKLENFRSYEFLEMPIKKGLNLIYGSNGSGKSTIIESIYYALSGKTEQATEAMKQFQRLMPHMAGATLKVQ